MQTAVSTLIIYTKRFSDIVETIKTNPEVSRWEIVDEGFHGLNDSIVKQLNVIASTRKIEYSVHAPFSSINIADADSTLRTAFVKVLKESLKRSSKLEAKRWVLHPGRLTPFTYFYPEEARKAHLKSLKELCKESEILDITLALENMVGPYDLFKSIKDGMELLNDIDNIWFCLDIGHANCTHNLDQFITTLPHLRHVHIHDNNGKNDDHLPIGNGNVQWVKVMRQLKKIKFKGWMVTENYALNDALKTLQYLSS